MPGPLPGPLTQDPHIPVLIEAILRNSAPVTGVWLDGTLGAGGYARALLAAGAERVIGVDRDPLALAMAESWAVGYGARVRLEAGTFSDLETLAGEPLDGVVLDLGVSSMQLDQAERGFSFLRDGPLDMRMSQDGPTAADLVNMASGLTRRMASRMRAFWRTSCTTTAKNEPRGGLPVPSSARGRQSRSRRRHGWRRSWRNACRAPSRGSPIRRHGRSRRSGSR